MSYTINGSTYIKPRTFWDISEVQDYLRDVLGGHYPYYDTDGLVDAFFDRLPDGGFVCDDDSDVFWEIAEKYDMTDDSNCCKDFE